MLTLCSPPTGTASPHGVGRRLVLGSGVALVTANIMLPKAKSAEKTSLKKSAPKPPLPNANGKVLSAKEALKIGLEQFGWSPAMLGINMSDDGEVALVPYVDTRNGDGASLDVVGKASPIVIANARATTWEIDGTTLEQDEFWRLCEVYVTRDAEIRYREARLLWSHYCTHMKQEALQEKINAWFGTHADINRICHDTITKLTSMCVRAKRDLKDLNGWICEAKHLYEQSCCRGQQCASSGGGGCGGSGGFFAALLAIVMIMVFVFMFVAPAVAPVVSMGMGAI